MGLPSGAPAAADVNDVAAPMPPLVDPCDSFMTALLPLSVALATTLVPHVSQNRASSDSAELHLTHEGLTCAFAPRDQM
jgi:hypothetical protein